MTSACCQPRRHCPREHRPWCGASMAWRLLSLVLKASSQREVGGCGWSRGHLGQLWHLPPTENICGLSGQCAGQVESLQERGPIPKRLVVDIQCPTLRSFTWGNIRVLGRTEPQGSPCFLSSADLMTLRTVLAVFGKGCLSGSFSCLFLFTSELYPTVTR